MSTQDYIFCPFCGSVKWTTDKSGYAQEGRLEKHECSGCKKFTYTNHMQHTKSPAGLEIFEKKRYSVVAHIDPYLITVNYFDKTTIFESWSTGTLILSLGAAVTFNWYKNDDLLEKIKLYTVFS